MFPIPPFVKVLIVIEVVVGEYPEVQLAKLAKSLSVPSPWFTETAHIATPSPRPQKDPVTALVNNMVVEAAPLPLRMTLFRLPKSIDVLSVKVPLPRSTY